MGNLAKLVLILVILAILIGVELYFSIISNFFLKPFFKEFELKKNVLVSKPTLSGKIISNPDFHYPDCGWLSPQEDPSFASDPLLEQADWLSNGWYENIIIDGRSDTIVIHPLSVETGRFIERSVSLPVGSYKLVVGVANIRGKISYATTPEIENYGDVLILVKIMDVSKGRWYIDTILVDNTEGWKDIEYDLKNKFSDKDIIIRIESNAGGPHGDWDGEWAAIDYIDIQKV